MISVSGFSYFVGTFIDTSSHSVLYCLLVKQKVCDLTLQGTGIL